MMKEDQLVEEFNRSLNINDAVCQEKYNRFRQQGKEAAQRGDLQLSLNFFRQAFTLCPSDKMQSRIQRLEEAIKELNVSEEEEEEFVDVLASGLMMYKGLYDQLYEHQKEGVAFLYSLHKDGRGGGILADDMGLGKTLQVISFLSAMYDAELINHTLLVMPTSLIKNWMSEFKRWTPGLRVKEFHGTSKTERSRNLERIQRGGGAIITTYQMLINNWQQLASFGGQEFFWDYIILDEAHKIKSSTTKTAKSVTAVPTRHRLLLTGTPVQNNLREMWALFYFACQGALLGSAKTFKTEYENPITRAREKDATPGEKALGLKISQNLTKLIGPYFLRRTKAEVQNRKQLQQRVNKDIKEQKVQNQQSTRVNEIPSLTRKTDLIVWLYLSEVQENVYRQFISLDHIKQLLTTTRSPLAELTVLKKLCDHPRLLSARAGIQLGFRTGSADFQEDDSQSAASSIVGVTDELLIDESGKLVFLLRLMERLRDEGKRTLVFSQSRKMLDIIERVLTNRKFCLLRVDGTITQLAERERRINLFQTDARYSVFLLTTQVGGVGLTLTAANRVVIFDPSWNPATDAQAVDRAYRIGQTHDVIIYRLITCGTVEEKIYRRQVFKDSLIRQTTGDKKNPFRYFTKQELKELFTLEDTHSSSTQLQLQSLHLSACRADPELQGHISALMGMNMFGVSRHDLLFSNEEDEEPLQEAESHYIEQRVQKAQELVQAESQLQSLMADSVNQNTEPAWLRLSRQQVPDQQTMMGNDKTTPSRHDLSPPVVVDLTQSESDELEMMSTDGGIQGKVECVIDASTHETEDSFVGPEFKSMNNEQSLIKEEKSDHIHTPSNHIMHSSPLNQSNLSVGLLEKELMVPNLISKELFMLEDTHSSSTQLQLQSLHLSVCRADPELQGHISALMGMNMFGVSRHDLLFSNEEDEEPLQEAETHYIEQHVQKAQELVQAESQLQSLMADSVNQNTEPAWLRLSGQQVPDQQTMMGNDKTTPSRHDLSPPVVVDLTQSESDELEMMSTDGGIQGKVECVIDVSTHETEDSFVGQEFKSMNNEQSLIKEEKSDHIHTPSNQIMHSSPLNQSNLSVGLLETELMVPNLISKEALGSHEASVEADFDESKVLLGMKLDSSVAPMTELDLSKSVEFASKQQTGAESFQGNFNLQLEDSAELLSEDKLEDENQEGVELSTGGEDFQLQMDDTIERIEQSDCVRQESVDESLLWPTKKKKLRVIYDSEEDEEQEVEKPVLASSPLADRFTGLECSTPKSMMTNGNKRRCSMNISIASRRSLVESLLQDMEEEEEEEEPEEGNQSEEEDGSKKVVLSHASGASGTYADESVLEEEEPSGETLNSELPSECEEEEAGCEEEAEVAGCEEEAEVAGCAEEAGCEEEEEEEEWCEEEEEWCEEEEAEEGCEEEEEEAVEGAAGCEEEEEEAGCEEEEEEGCEEEEEEGCEEEEEEEEEGDVVNFFDESTDVELASSEVLDQCAPAVVQSTNDISYPEETFESLVLSGKCCLADGRIQEALDFFLKAIDINTGDSEIQLLIIQLYRQLSQ